MEGCCRLRAISETGTPVIFTVDSVPVRITEDKFILANRPDSPILYINSTVRVMDNMDVGEGDTVRIGDKVCTVQYVRGFQFVSESGATFPSNTVKSCELLDVGMKSVSAVQFHSPNAAFRLRAFLGMYNGKVVTAHDPIPCASSMIRVSAGFVYQRQKVCYGDEVDGHTLIMWRGRPCIRTREGFIEIPTHFYLGKE